MLLKSADVPPSVADEDVPPAPETAWSPPRWRPGRLAQRRTVLGVDVGTHSIKMVQVRQGRRGFVVVNFWILPNLPGFLAESLGETVRTYRLRRRRSVSAIGLQKGLTRLVRFPRMTAAEVGKALRLEADTYVPMPLETSVFDFIVAGEDAGRGQEGREMEVLVAAAPREAVAALAATLKGAGLRPVAIEPEPLAAYRALRAMELVPRSDAGLVAVIDLGDSATKVSVFRRGFPVAGRAVKPGGRDFAEAISLGSRFTGNMADAAKRHWGVAPGTPVAPLVEGLVQSLLTEVWQSLESFLVLAKAQRLDGIFLIGGNALQPALAPRVDAFLARRLNERFGQHPPEGGLVRLANPGAAVRFPSRLREAAAEFDSRMVVALGLALWKGSP